jgi:REP element-mobilizing transposase RayT
MARKPRVNDPGFYHIVNRGVNGAEIFNEKEDFFKFMELMLKTKYDYKVIFHAFTILPNHYHILLETTLPNLSEAMRFLNSAYAAWYNYKTGRIGHLWKGRFESYMMFDDAHSSKVIKYIERNALVLGLVKDIKDYEYQSLSLRLKKNKFNEIIEGSKIFQKPLEEYIEWLNQPLEKFELEEIYNEPKIVKVDGELKVIRKKISDFFEEYEEKKDAILAAKEAGYKYTEIARYLGVSNGYINKILKNNK